MAKCFPYPVELVRNMFKVVVAGGRNFDNYELLKNKLDVLLSKKKEEGEEIVIISGGARGADSLGEKYAREKGLKLDVFKANWDKFGKRAGIIRNREMGENCDGVVVFWDGVSRGSKNMIEVGNELGKIVKVVKY